MLKYLNTEITFSEVPDEITLCVNITGCKNACEGCHSPWLAKDIGEPLGYNNLLRLINSNKGITCISFMGGDSEPEWVATLAWKIRREFPDLKIAWYSGRQYIPDNFPTKNFDFIKIGPYIEKLGPLTSPTTNQIMYQVIDNNLVDITYKFWKNAIKDSL